MKKIGRNKFMVDDEDVFDQKDLVEWLVKNVNSTYRKALAKDYAERNPDEVNKLLIEGMKEGKRYDTAKDFDRAVKKGEIIIEEA